MPQKHKARVDPDSLLGKSLKKVVYGRLGLETAGVRRRGQSLKQKQSEVSDPGHSPGTDIGVTGSWNAEPWGTDPAGLDLGEGGQRDQEPGEEELVIESIGEPGEEEPVIESIDKHPDKLHGKPATEPPDNLEHTKWGQGGEIDFTDVTLASEDCIETKAHRLSSATEVINPPGGESLPW